MKICYRGQQVFLKSAESQRKNKTAKRRSKFSQGTRYLPLTAWHSFILNFITYYFFKDTTGEILGVYRKTHIPDGMPYAEKFYFTPGDSGFKVWDTAYCL